MILDEFPINTSICNRFPIATLDYWRGIIELIMNVNDN